MSGACIVALMALSILTTAAPAQTKSGIDKLYVLNCGEGVAGDISRWSPGVNVGKSMDFVDNCYLMHLRRVGCFGTPASPTLLPPCRRGRLRPIRA
jgi:hypothetical protein